MNGLILRSRMGMGMGVLGTEEFNLWPVGYIKSN